MSTPATTPDRDEAVAFTASLLAPSERKLMPAMTDRTHGPLVGAPVGPLLEGDPSIVQEALRQGEEFIVTESGATRGAHVAGEKGSKFPVRYELISPIGLECVAQGFGTWAREHGEDWFHGLSRYDLFNLACMQFNKWGRGLREGTLGRGLACLAKIVELDTKGESRFEYLTVMTSIVPRATAEFRYDLIPIEFVKRLAETYGEGALKYTDHNWWKGFKEKMLLSHGWAHLWMYSSGDRTEDHLAHGSWNFVALAHFQQTRPDLLDLQHAIAENKAYVSRDVHPLDVQFTGKVDWAARAL